MPLGAFAWAAAFSLNAHCTPCYDRNLHRAGPGNTESGPDGMGFPVKVWPWNPTLFLSNATTPAPPGPAISTLWPVHTPRYTCAHALVHTHIQALVYTCIHTQRPPTHTHTPASQEGCITIFSLFIPVSSSCTPERTCDNTNKW